MAIKQVVAYFIDDSERAAALEVLDDATVTDSFVLGSIAEESIPALREKGLVVQEELDAAAASDQQQALRVAHMNAVGYNVQHRLPVTASAVEEAAVDDDNHAAVDDEDLPLPQEIDYYRFFLKGPLLEEWRQKLEAAGVARMDKSRGGYKTRLSSAQFAAVSLLPFVAQIRWLEPRDSAAIVRTQSVAPPPGEVAPASGVKMLTFDLRLRDPAGKQTVLDWLENRHVSVAGSSSWKIRFYATEDSPLLTELGVLPEVDIIAEFIPPKFFNDISRVLLEVDAIDATGAVAAVLTQDGTDQIVAVADSGIDDTHPDFQNRIVGKSALGRPGQTNDPKGHGTHVAGSILGDGMASNGKIKGIAPKAKLFFQSLLDVNGELGGLPINLNDLFSEAYLAGARIHNNSWGSNTPSFYTMNSEEVDEYVWNQRDMLIVIAAGNAGSGSSMQHAAAGFVDWLSIGSPASSKNALTVGASRSSRTDGAFSKVTYGQGWPTVFPQSPIASATVSGDPQGLAAFSSRGPCDDRRIKPDVVAPGTDIVSTKSSLAPISEFWGPYTPEGATQPDPNYAYDGGTSMATPLVSGCAALVRQYYVESGVQTPSAALIKATLINSAEWLTGEDSVAPAPGNPNYHQGHGRICMSRAIPNPSRPAMNLRFVDGWQTFRFTRTGERKIYRLVLPAVCPELRMCLTYTDAPGRGLQNNVNLIVQCPPLAAGGGATKILGNQNLPDKLVLPDPDNNVETILIRNAPAGTYLLQVVMSNLVKSGQDFALVITGDGVPALTEIGV